MSTTVGQKIREMRIKKGLTQMELAAGIVTASMVSQIESDKANPSQKVMELIALRLETPVDYFFTDVDAQLQQSTRYKLAKASMALKDYTTAVKFLSGIEETTSTKLNYTDVLLNLGECYFHLQRYDEAAVTLTNVLERAESASDGSLTVQALHLVGLVEIATKKHHNGIYHMRKAFDMFELINHEPLLQSKIATDLGKAFFDVGDIEEAFRMFNYANIIVKELDDKKHLVESYIELSKTCLQNNQYKMAHKYASDANAICEMLSQVKLSLDVQKSLIMLQAKTSGDFASAVPDLIQLVAKYKNENFALDAISTMGDIGECYLQQGQYEHCISWCDEAIAEEPNQFITAPMLFTKGKALSKLEQFSDALDCLETALAAFKGQNMTAEYANACEVVAGVYKEQGELANSIDFLFKVKSSYDDSLRNRGIVL